MRSALLVPALIVGWGGVLLGYDLALARISIPYVASEFSLYAFMEELLLLSSLAGCFTGALLLGRRADFYGRRSLLMILPLIYMVAAIGAGVANNIPAFILFRVLAGMSVGGLAVVAPIYLSELSSPDKRGRVVAAFPLFLGAGILLAVLSDHMAMDYNASNWRYMMIFGALPALISIPLILFIPQSPRWLMQKGQERVARFIIHQVNPGVDRDKVIDEIKESINIEIMAEHAYLFRPPFLKLVMTGILLGALNPMTGIIAVLHHAPVIFRSAGLSSGSFNVTSLVIGLASIVSVAIAMFFIDSAGRKKLLVFGSAAMAFTLALLALLAFIDLHAGMILSVAVIGFTGFFAFSQGTVIWVLMSELFPYNIRTRAVSLGMLSLFLFCLSMSYLIPRLEVIMGMGMTYVIFAVISALSSLFYGKFLFETRRRSLEEMERETVKRKSDVP